MTSSQGGFGGRDYRPRRSGLGGMALAELHQLAESLHIDTTGLGRVDLIAKIKKHFESVEWSRARAARSAASSKQSAVSVMFYVDEYERNVADTDSSSRENEHDPLAPKAGADGLELPAPPRARVLRAVAVLLAPAERENWRAELETARWELRGDPQARRRASRSHLRHLLGAVWASWHHGGSGPSAAELR